MNEERATTGKPRKRLGVTVEGLLWSVADWRAKIPPAFVSLILLHLFQSLSGTTPALANTLTCTCSSESNGLQNPKEPEEEKDVQEDVQEDEQEDVPEDKQVDMQAECNGQDATSQVMMHNTSTPVKPWATVGCELTALKVNSKQQYLTHLYDTWWCHQTMPSCVF